MTEFSCFVDGRDAGTREARRIAHTIVRPGDAEQMLGPIHKFDDTWRSVLSHLVNGNADQWITNHAGDTSEYDDQAGWLLGYRSAFKETLSDILFDRAVGERLTQEWHTPLVLTIGDYRFQYAFGTYAEILDSEGWVGQMRVIRTSDVVEGKSVTLDDFRRMCGEWLVARGL